ncbi:MAG: hypothetical protein J6C23_08000 [Clostridia bacterium]|nr:hypothetical protein [Clostridia bacterium]
MWYNSVKAKLRDEENIQMGADLVIPRMLIASEWMQPVGCEKYGSDNSIFISKITV